MNYCIIKVDRIILISKKNTEEYHFDLTDSTEENPPNEPLSLAMARKLKSGDFNEFLKDHVANFCRENKSRIYFILDNPWVDVRNIRLPLHKKGKTRQILAFNLSSEFILEIENIIFDFYTYVSKDNQNIQAVVFACNKMLSETISSVCIESSVALQGIIPYSHLVEGKFRSENKNITSHVHIEPGINYTSFFCFQDNEFINYLPLSMTGDSNENLKRIRHRLGIIMSNLSETANVTLNSANKHLYQYLESEEEEFNGDIIEDNSYDKINGLIEQTRKDKRFLNLLRIQNPFLLDILRTKIEFMRVAMIFAAIVIIYVGFKGVTYYIKKQQYDKLNVQAMNTVRKISPESKSVTAAVRSMSNLRDDLFENWESRIDLSYRSYNVSELMKILDEIRKKIPKQDIQTMRFEEGYVEYTGNVDNIDKIDELEELNRNAFPEFEVDIKQKRIGKSFSYTLKMTKKNQPNGEEEL